MGLSNYPPGVTGNEPQISGIYPIAETVEYVQEQLNNARNSVEEAICQLDDQGHATDSDNKQANKIIELIDDLKNDVGYKAPDPYDYDDGDDGPERHYDDDRY